MTRKSLLIVFAAIVSLLSIQSCGKKTAEKPKYLWMCIDANFERFTNKDSICFYLDKAKETGFNGVVVDVRGVDGYVLYESDFMPELTRVEGFTYERDWDYLGYFLEQIRERGMTAHVSASIFPIGSPIHHSGPVYDDPELAKLTCLEYTPDGMMKIEDDKRKVAAFMNPILPESREYAMRYLRELFTKYDFDTFSLDYCRFADAESDFSEASKLAFEEYLGHEVENFPQDVFTYNDNRERVPGKYYKEWWTFRAKVIRDFIEEVAAMRDEVKPDVKLQYWAASWLHAIYTQGQNWASPESRFYDEYRDVWATEDYNEAAFADLIDVFITGTYLERVWGMEDLESIEFGIYRTHRDNMGACEVHGSLYAQNYNEFEDAVYLSLSRNSGLMVFDLVQVIHNSLWDEIKAGIDRAEAEIE